jgi:hypothetical protein
VYARLDARTCGGLARHVGERVARIRHNEQHRVGRRMDNTRNNVAIDFVEKPQPTLRIVAVGCAAAFSLTPEVITTTAAPSSVIVVRNVEFRRERRAVTKVGSDRLSGFPRAVDQHDFARAVAVDGGHGGREEERSRLISTLETEGSLVDAQLFLRRYCERWHAVVPAADHQTTRADQYAGRLAHHDPVTVRRRRDAGLELGVGSAG